LIFRAGRGAFFGIRSGFFGGGFCRRFGFGDNALPLHFFSGELIHRGACIYKGFWNAPEETAQRFKSISILDKVREPEGQLTDEIVIASGDYVYADEEGFILGGEIFSPMAEELVAIVSMALAGEMDTGTVKGTILAHPTISESLETAFRKL